MKSVVRCLDGAQPPQGNTQGTTCVVSESCQRPGPELLDPVRDLRQLPGPGPALLLLGSVALHAADGHVPGRRQPLEGPGSVPDLPLSQVAHALPSPTHTP